MIFLILLAEFFIDKIEVLHCFFVFLASFFLLDYNRDIQQLCEVVMQATGVIGAGIWGTALALTAARAGNNVLCWARRQEVVEAINQQHCNPLYLPDVPLPDGIKATSDPAEVFAFSDVVLLAVSAQATRTVVSQMRPFMNEHTILVLCAKGIEAGSGKMLSEVVQEEAPMVTTAVLSGPGFAFDLARRKLVSVTIGCRDLDKASLLAERLGTAYFRPYTTSDIVSPQIGGSVKNVIAIASGIVEGAALGDSARAVLVARGFNEMARLSNAMGGSFYSLMGMCGLGDLVLTAGCSQSRNFSFGYEIGVCGNAEKLIAENKRTVEGLATAKAVVKRARSLGVEMPICEMMNRVLFEALPIETALEELLSRPYKEEGF